MISYVIPTRDRPAELAWTLEALSRLGDHAEVGGGEVLVIDNDSRVPTSVGPRLPGGLPVRVLRHSENRAAASRNVAAAAADPRADWLVMLDDDSHPVGRGHFGALREAEADVAAVAAEVFVPAPGGVRHEAGGLPEVFVGCGVAIRREVFARLGGYDGAFDYYAEEYDLAARLMLAGQRIGFDARFGMMHRKVSAGRDLSRILHRLVRNNLWVMQRYAPDEHLEGQVAHTLERYRGIAEGERALDGYQLGVAEWVATRSAQKRRPLPRAWWDRFTGLAHARAALAQAHQEAPIARAEVVCPGKNEWAVRRALEELNIPISTGGQRGAALVVGTLSPGPMLDAATTLATQRPGERVVLPWVVAERLAAGAGTMSGAAGAA